MTLFQDNAFVSALSEALGYTAKSIRACSPSRQADLLRELQAKAPAVAAQWAGKGIAPAAHTLQDATVEQLVECLVRRAKDIASLDAVLDMVCVAGAARADELRSASQPGKPPAAQQPQKPAAATEPAKPQASKPAATPPSKPQQPAAPKPTMPADAPEQKQAAQEPQKSAALSPSTPTARPATYKALLALGKPHVEHLARDHGIDTGLAWPQLLKAVWAKVKPAASSSKLATKQSGKDKKAAAAQKSAARTTADAAKPATPPAPVDPIVPGLFDAVGKPVTLSAVMSALSKLPPAGKKVA